MFTSIEQSNFIKACEQGHLEDVTKLSKHKNVHADCFSSDFFYPSTALILASRNGHLQVVKYLIEDLKADANIKDDMHTTPLMTASCGGHLNIAKYLVEERNVDVNLVDNYGFTALMLAIESERVETVKFLINTGKADTLICGRFCGKTALMLACKNGQANIVKAILCKNKLKKKIQLLINQSNLVSGSSFRAII